MAISDRKRKILQVVVDDYITSAVPVSSKNIHEHHLEHLSPATIRSELAALEEMGYLIQPHTSAGRIPSSMAYRMYVDELMTRPTLTRAEFAYIKESFYRSLSDVEQVVKNAAKVICDLTNYTSVASFADYHSERVMGIRLIRLTETTVIMIIVTDKKQIRDFILDNDIRDDEEFIAMAEKLLNRIFSGKSLAELKEVSLSLDGEFERYRLLFDSVMEKIRQYANTSRQVVLEGGSKIFEYPEYNDIGRVRNFMSVIDSKEKLRGLLSAGEGFEINVRIGDENEGGELSDFSLVSANLKCNGMNIGTAGVLGPVRMNYGKVIKVMEGIGEVLRTISEENEDK